MSTTVTSLPRSARQAGDGLQGGAAPAELARSLQAGPAPALALADHRGRRLAQGRGVAVHDEHSRVAYDLGDARVAEGRDRASAGHRLQARQPKPFIATREDQAARGRVEVGEVPVGDMAQLDGALHARGGLAARRPHDHQLDLGARFARRGPCGKQGTRVLAGVEGAHKQEVDAVQAVALLHTLGCTFARPEHGVSRLRDHAQPLAGGDVQPCRILGGCLRDGDHGIRRQPTSLYRPGGKAGSSNATSSRRLSSESKPARTRPPSKPRA